MKKKEKFDINSNMSEVECKRQDARDMDALYEIRASVKRQRVVRERRRKWHGDLDILIGATVIGAVAFILRSHIPPALLIGAWLTCGGVVVYALFRRAIMKLFYWTLGKYFEGAFRKFFSRTREN